MNTQLQKDYQVIVGIEAERRAISEKKLEMCDQMNDQLNKCCMEYDQINGPLYPKRNRTFTTPLFEFLQKNHPEYLSEYIANQANKFKEEKDA